MDILEPLDKRLGRYFVPRAAGGLECVDRVLAARPGELHRPEAFILLVLHRGRNGFRRRRRNRSGDFVYAVFRLPGRKLEKSKNF